MYLTDIIGETCLKVEDSENIIKLLNNLIINRFHKNIGVKSYYFSWAEKAWNKMLKEILFGYVIKYKISNSSDDSNNYKIYDK